MSQASPLLREREVMSFSVEGLSAREELLLKSFVRLLSHCTIHTWLYIPRPTTLQAEFKVDLRIVSDNIILLLRPQFQQFLTLGTVLRQGDEYLRLPLHAEELEKKLNLKGNLITASRTVLNPSTRSDSSGSNSKVRPDLTILPYQTMHLLRWPPTTLLGSTARIRLATLLIRQPLTLTALEMRSGLPGPVCAEFVGDLKRAGFIEMVSTTSPPARPPEKLTAAPKVQPGLLARIRLRFGFQKSGRA